jgi:hypothetical protein
MRQLSGASGMALLAPVTMIGALAVLALGGSFGGLGALGQLVSGPAVPPGSAAAGGRTPHLSSPALPVVPAGRRGARTAARIPTRAVARAPVHARSHLSHARGGRQLLAPSGHGTTGAPPKLPPPPSSPAPPVSAPTPPPATGPVVSLVNQVVALGVSVTSQLPAPLSALGTGLLDSVGQTVDGLLTPPS